MPIFQWPWTAWTTQGGRLAQIKAGTPSNLTSPQDLRYTYDAVGNVLKLDDHKAGSPQTQRFGYDALDRLITATVSGGTGGLYPAQNYQYDPTGNLTSKTGVGGYAYNAAAPGGGACQAGTRATKPHALDTAGSVNFDYDCNGNVITRVVSGTTYTLGYSVENMLVSVSGGASASFVYDGNGRRVKGTVAGVTTVYVGDYYEWTGSTATARRYYYAGGQRIAERVGDSTLYFLLGDHLGSTSITANSGGGFVAEVRYMPWGETRYVTGTTPTTFRYTGQRQESGLGGTNGLYDYGARWLDPYVGRWLQADSIVPEPGNPQALNRYSMVLNNPVKYTDPTGHKECDLDCQIANEPVDPIRIHWGEAYLGDCFGAVQCLAGGNPNSVLAKALAGDPVAALDAVTPTHIGVRSQVEFNLPVGPAASGTVGFQITYGRKTHRIAFSMDVSPELGPSWMPPVDAGLKNPIKLGVSATTGPIVGWFASDVDSITSGVSPIVSGSYAFGSAFSASASSSTSIDPVYGAAPVTYFFGAGFGCCYASGGAGLSVVPGAQNVPGVGPVEFQRIIAHPLWR